MGRTVKCVKLNKEAEGLEYLPYPGDLGQRVYEQVSAEAWAMWVDHQTMLINEYRLVPFEAKAREYLEGEMEKFFFGEGVEAPQGYVPPK